MSDAAEKSQYRADTPAVPVVKSHRSASSIGTIGPRAVIVHDGDAYPWQDYRASLARVADERPWALTCRSCGCELDYGPPAHSPRCQA